MLYNRFFKGAGNAYECIMQIAVKNGILIKNLAILLYGKEEENGKEKREGIASHIRICCFIFRSWHIV